MTKHLTLCILYLNALYVNWYFISELTKWSICVTCNSIERPTEKNMTKVKTNKTRSNYIYKKKNIFFLFGQYAQPHCTRFKMQIHIEFPTTTKNTLYLPLSRKKNQNIRYVFKDWLEFGVQNLSNIFIVLCHVIKIQNSIKTKKKNW